MSDPFDRELEQYVPLDRDAWLRDHDIRKKARKNGEQNHPPTDQNEPDGVHYEIKTAINGRGFQCQNIVSNHLSDLVQQLNATLEQENQAVLRQKIVEEAEATSTAIEKQISNDKDKLTRLKDAVGEGKRNYENFRREANPPLDRLPDYSDRRNALLWVFWIALLEVTLNASLLSEKNPFGLGGAILQMSVITGINIVVGLSVMGSALRYRNFMSDQSHAKKLKAWGAWSLMIILVPIIVAYNLLVGHFRDSMQAPANTTKTDSAIAMIGDDTLPRMIADPFGLDSLFSILLVIVGVICFGIASWKGYRSDDPYPDYGRRHRQVTVITNNYRNAVRAVRENLEEQYETHRKKLEDIRHQVEIQQSAWLDLHERGQHIVNEYPGHLGQYQHDLNHLIAVYRDENQMARTEPPPAFFNQPLSIDEQILEPPAFEPPAEGDWTNTTDTAHKAILKIQKCYQNALVQYPTLEDIADNQE